MVDASITTNSIKSNHFCKCGHRKSVHFINDEKPRYDYGCTCFGCSCGKFRPFEVIYWKID